MATKLNSLEFNIIYSIKEVVIDVVTCIVYVCLCFLYLCHLLLSSKDVEWFLKNKGLLLVYLYAQNYIVIFYMVRYDFVNPSISQI